MRNKNTVAGTLGRIAVGVVAASFWTGTSTYAAGGGEPQATSGKGGGATNGGGQSAPAPAGEHPANAGGGGTPVNAGGNTAPAAKSATPSAARPNATNSGPAGQNHIGARENQRQNRYYSEEVYGDAWSPYAYGWYGENYPYGADYAAPVYSDPGSATPTDNSNQPTMVIPSGPPTAAIMANAVEKSPDMVAANNVVKSAQDAYDSERTRVMMTLKDKPEYQQAVARKQDAAAKVEVAKTVPTTQGSIPAPVLTEAATVKMDASSEVTKMEERAVANDSDAAAAKARLKEAVANRDELRARMMAQH